MRPIGTRFASMGAQPVDPDVCGESFTAKDIRTWRGTALVVGQLSQLPPPASEREARRNVTAAIRPAAQKLGNTVSVCRKYYVHPLVVELYQRGEMAERRPRFRPRSHSLLDVDEQFLLHLLKRAEKQPRTTRAHGSSARHGDHRPRAH